MAAHMLQEPLWLQLWLAWLGLVNLAALAFLARTEARWVLGAFLANLVFMSGLYAAVGYVRLLGLSHVLFWTPLLAYLWTRGVPRRSGGGFATWLKLLFVTNGVSLVIDYLDVARYLLGERG